jgi:hypothetical protein
VNAVFPTRGAPGVGGGRDLYVRAPAQRRATTAQVKGLYPWVVGGGSPMIGAPTGKTLRDNGSVTLCCDPISYFERGHLISNPLQFVLGLPALGKSTLVRRQIIGMAGQGICCWVLGDVKEGGEYVPLIRALGGQVIRLGRGRGYLNILDMGAAPAAAARIGGGAGAALLADAKFRRQLGVESLITVQRGTEPSDDECFIVTAALECLDRTIPGEPHETAGKGPDSSRVPILRDLLNLIADPPQQVKDAALWRGDIAKYYAATDSLQKSVAALTSDTGLGEVFSRATTVQIDRTKPLVFDISGVDEADRKLRSALLMACWTVGFGQIGVTHALSDAGLEPARKYCLILDELWSALRGGTGLVDRVDALSRLNRDKGVGVIMVSHTMDDLKALPTEEDRRKAAGLVERAGILICAGLPRSEMPALQGVAKFTAKEMAKLTSWSTPASWHTIPGRRRKPPGQGLFLLKAGSLPGIPFELKLTEAEAGLNDTSKRWDI